MKIQLNGVYLKFIIITQNHLAEQIWKKRLIKLTLPHFHCVWLITEHTGIDHKKIIELCGNALKTIEYDVIDDESQNHCMLPNQ